jgi:signal transduction histidine kinase/CheY-like chemotaxis protein
MAMTSSALTMTHAETLNVLAVPPIVMGGVCAFVAFYHMWVAVKGITPKVNFSFAVTCLFIALYDVLCSGLYNSSSLAEGVFWQKLQIQTSFAMFTAFCWFIYHLTKMKSVKSMYVLTVSYAAVLLFSFADKGQYTLSLERPAVKNVIIWGGRPLTYFEAEPELLFQVAMMMQVILLLIFLINVYRYARSKNYHGAFFLFISILFFIAAAVNDTLVASNVYSSVYLMEYFYLIIIVHMTYMLLNRFVESHENFEKLNAELEARVSERTFDLERALEQVRQLADKAESSNVAKSAFLANMSHEIRTPMNGLIGFTDLLTETDLDEDQRDYVMTIKQSGTSLLSLLNDILDFSKIEAGELSLENIEFDIESLCYDVCDLLRPRIGSKPVVLICRVEERVPSRLLGDPNRIRQVLTNLMGNASKFTEEGEIELCIRLEEEDGRKAVIHGLVRDTGAGIPPEKQNIIFEPFQQADNSDTRRYGGTGLGLSICRQIVGLMSGLLWVESRVGEGSVFHFKLGLEKVQGKNEGKQSFTALSGKRVLVCDTHAGSLAILKGMLESQGMTVKGVSSEKEVFPVLSAGPFDLFLACLRSSASPLLETAETVRGSDTSFSGIPMIALSSVSELMTRRCERAGFNAFLNLPVRRDRLLRTVQRVLDPEKGKDSKPGSEPDAFAFGRHALAFEKPVNILLAEDNPVNQKLARVILKREGFNVEVADNGLSAVEKFLETPSAFHLIFMDVHMPKMDGLAATRAIRGAGHTSVPIIAMTAHAMKGFRENCLEAGMNDYISKPIQIDKVFEMISRWVRF